MGCGASVPLQGAVLDSAPDGSRDPSAPSASSASSTARPEVEPREGRKPTVETQIQVEEQPTSILAVGQPLSSNPLRPVPTGAASSFARLFREYAGAPGAEVTSRPVSRPQYDPLMDEIFAISSGEELSREPLVSPKYVMRAAEILAVDLLEESFLVPVLKTLLPSLSSAYQSGRLEEELSLSLSLLAKERQAQRQVAPEHPERACEECGGEPIDYCPECEGVFCRGCFQRLHCRGRRAEHLRLDLSMAGFKMKSNVETMQNQVVNVQWHPFHDDHGIRYYYNFETHRSVRQLSRKELMWRPPPPLPT